MEEIDVKSLNYEELLQLEDKVKKYLKKLDADYKETKAKGGK